MQFLTWLEMTDFSTWLRESDWGYPVLLCFHAVGMGTVVGISWMYSARILGYAKSFPLDGFERLFSLAWFGFVINAASGVLLFIGEPRRLAATPAFWISSVRNCPASARSSFSLMYLSVSSLKVPVRVSSMSFTKAAVVLTKRCALVRATRSKSRLSTVP